MFPKGKFSKDTWGAQPYEVFSLAVKINGRRKIALKSLVLGFVLPYGPSLSESLSSCALGDLKGKVHTYIYTHIYVCMYMYMYIFIHTHTHTDTFAWVHVSERPILVPQLGEQRSPNGTQPPLA